MENGLGFYISLVYLHFLQIICSSSSVHSFMITRTSANQRLLRYSLCILIPVSSHSKVVKTCSSTDVNNSLQMLEEVEGFLCPAVDSKGLMMMMMMMIMMKITK